MWGALIAALISAVGGGITAGVTARNNREAAAQADATAKEMAGQQRADQLVANEEDTRRYNEQIALEKEKIHTQKMQNFVGAMNNKLGMDTLVQTNVLGRM